MQKALVVTICFLLSANLTHAGLFSWGPRWGVHIPQHQDNSRVNDTKPVNLLVESCWCYHMGAFARFNLLVFYVQPEIISTSTGIQLSDRNQTSTFRLTKLNMPAMVGCSFFRIVRVQIGPVFGLLLTTKKERDNVEKCYRTPSIGWQAGFGIDIWRVFIDLKYEKNLSRWGDKAAYIPTDSKYASWTLSVGVNIF